MQTDTGAALEVHFGRERVAALRTLARREGATLFMTLLAAWAVLLARHAGQDDVVVGSPVAGRSHLEFEPMLGLFVNVLPLRVELARALHFDALLAHVRTSVLDAFEHDAVPFEKLVEALAPPRDLSRSPVFQTMFALRNADPIASGRPRDGLALEPVPIETRSAQFELTLSLVDDGDTLRGEIEYNTDLFDPATVARLAARFDQLLATVARHPTLPLATLPLLLPGERDARLALAAGPPVASEDPASVIARFEARAHETPDAIALVHEGGTVTYGALAARARRLARVLRRHGVGRESRVAVGLPRSLDWIVALLAVFEAGGAYLPIDPALPPARRSYLLEDARPVLLLVDREADPDASDEVPRLDVVASAETIARESDAPLALATGPHDLAYVVYTSGSTGQPKGVAVTHGALAHHARAIAQRYALTPRDRVLQFAAMGFDVAAEEIFPTLALGATVVLRPELATQPLAAIGPRLEADGVTVANLPASWWHAWVADLVRREALAPASLRLLVVGSEPPRAAALEDWKRAGGSSRWLNAYGPSEATVTAATFDPVEDPAAARRAEPGVPIGRAVPGVTMYVLDEAGEPVPSGVVGEVHLAGPTLARGYLARPGLTATRFVPDPLGAPGSRRLQTGDLARVDEAGVATFVGRADRQVKIRGVRIELAEVEAALATDPTVGEVSVALDREGTDDARLVAYVTPTDAHTPVDLASLRALAASRLPTAMVPAAFVALDALPRFASGKIDARALPSPEATTATATDAPLVAPRDATELRLAALWESLLGIAPIGVTQDFFALGGHSLLALGLVSEIAARFGRAVDVASLFRHPTIESLAVLLRDGAAVVAPSPCIPIQPAGDLAPFFCVHPVGGDVVRFAPLARRMGTARPFVGLRSTGLEPGGRPVASLVAMATDYVAAVRAMQPHGPYHLGGWSLGGLVAYEMARQLEAAGESVASLSMLDTAPSIAGAGIGPRWEDFAPADLVSMSFFGEAFLARVQAARPALLVLDADAQRDAMTTLAHTMGVVPPSFGAADLARVLEVFRANQIALRDYTVPMRHGRLLVLRAAEEDTDAGPTDDAHARARHQRDLGWSERVQGPVDVVTVPGTHDTMLNEPQVATLAATLRESMQDGIERA